MYTVVEKLIRLIKKSSGLDQRTSEPFRDRKGYNFKSDTPSHTSLLQSSPQSFIFLTATLCFTFENVLFLDFEAFADPVLEP